jgi:HEAT repeat protein/beta-lactamase regulating signal transducer with metallopeptidase domain
MNTAAGATSILSWLLTYALHSTVLLVMAKMITSRKMTAASRDVIWKSALVGGIVTASIQQAFEIRPSGSMALPAKSAPLVQPAGYGSTGGIVKDKEAKLALDKSETDLASAPSAATAELSAPSARLSLTEGLVLGWAIVAVLLAVAYGARRLILVGRLGDRRRVNDEALASILASLQGPGRKAQLTSSTAISSPVALGLNEICIPEAAITELDAEQQRGLLAHELAHLERRDPVWLDAVSVLERVFFFQPLNRMARREMQMAAEHLCDDWAAQRLGSGVPLAKCLAQVAEWIQASPLGVPVAGMAEQRSQLVERIARLVDRTARVKPASRALVTVGALALIAGVIAAAPGVQAAQLGEGKAANANEETEKQTNETENKTFDATDSQGRGPSPSPSPSPSGSPNGESVRTYSLEQQGQNEEQDPAIIAALIERLKDSDAGVRRAAANSLGNLKSTRAVTPLIDILDDKDKEVRMSAINALGNLQDARAVTPLLALVRDPSVGVRQAVFEALGNFEHEDIPSGPVIAALSDANADVRHRAINILGHIRDRAATSALIKATQDVSPEVRASAVEALSEMKDGSAVPSILNAVKDENPEVRHRAVHALSNMHAAVPEKTMLDLIGDSNADVRQGALELVRERPFTGAVAAVAKLLDDPNSDVRVEAVSTLGEIRDPAARRALQVALTSKDAKVRARAAEVLGERP